MTMTRSSRCLALTRSPAVIRCVHDIAKSAKLTPSWRLRDRRLRSMVLCRRCPFLKSAQLPLRVTTTHPVLLPDLPSYLGSALQPVARWTCRWPYFGGPVRFCRTDKAISRPMAPCGLLGFGISTGPKLQAPTSLPPSSSSASLRHLKGVPCACPMGCCLHSTTAASGHLCVAGQRAGYARALALV